MKIKRGLFSTEIELTEEDYKRFPSLTHYNGKNNGCLYCSSMKAPALFISTPKGYNHFYELYIDGQGRNTIQD